MAARRPDATLSPAARLAEARRLAPYHLYRAGARMAQLVPRPVAGPLAAGAAVVVGRAGGSRRRLAARHLERVTGVVLPGAAGQRRVDRAFASYGRYWMDAFRLPALDAEALEAGMVYEGIGHLEVARAAGRGAIMAMPHVGAWDWGGAWLSQTGYPVTVVAEALEPPELFEWFAAWRRRLGMTVIPLDRQAGGAVTAALRKGETVGLLCDRDLTGDGIEVDFFGERTTLPAGPATLALRTGAALLPCAVLFEGPLRRGIVAPPLDTARHGSLRADVTRVTQDLADALAALIRRAPEQWHVFQPNWPSDRLGER